MKEFLKVSAHKIERVQVAGWGEVFLRSWTVRERSEFLAYNKAHPDDSAEVQARIIASSMCNEHGERMLDESDLPALLDQPAYLLDHLAEIALTLNGLTDKAIDNAKKN